MQKPLENHCFLHVYARIMHVHLFIGLSAHQSVCLSIILSICLSIRPSTRLWPHCKNCKIYCKIKWNQLEFNGTIQLKQLTCIEWKKKYWKENCIEKPHCCLYKLVTGPKRSKSNTWSCDGQTWFCISCNFCSYHAQPKVDNCFFPS